MSAVERTLVQGESMADNSLGLLYCCKGGIFDNRILSNQSAVFVYQSSVL